MEQHSFGYWLRLKRKALDLTREELAERVGYSAATIRKIEDEERHPSAQIVERLAEIFNISPNERKEFLEFARGDWKSAPHEIVEEIPWHASNKSARSNLPATVTSLVGREKEIADVREYLLKTDIRLVTLMGPPGIGKTRLSLETARACWFDFPDGIFFVALAPLDDPSLILRAIIQALGYIEAANMSAEKQLVGGIGDKQMLIVLDNCEHLIEDVASLTSELLSTCPRLKILATSRESLRIPGEWLYPVPAFDVPGESSAVDMEIIANFPALTLFAERARAVRPDFVLDAENIKTVFAICAHLDGLPLVIELIAARMRLMSPESLLARLNDQFILTADGMRPASARQKTLNNAINWSYNLLSTEEQKLFAYLSIFLGGFTLEAAESIFSQTVTEKSISTLITSLVDKSLLQRSSDRQARGEPHYTMLVTVQEFARDRLRKMGEEPEIHNAHLAYFLDLAGWADKELRGPNQLEWLNRLNVMQNNLRTALDWAIETGQTEAALQLVRKLHWFWFVRGSHAEGRQWLQRVLEMPDTPLYHGAQAHALTQLAHHTYIQIRPSHAKPYAEQGLLIARAHQDEHNTARALAMLGLTLINEENFVAAQSALEESQALFRKVHDEWGYAHAVFCLGWGAFSQEDWLVSLALMERALTVFSQSGDQYFKSATLRYIGTIQIKQGNSLQGQAALQESLIFAQQLDSKFEIANTLWRMGEVAQAEGNLVYAVHVYWVSRNVFESIGAWQQEVDTRFENRLTACRAALGESAFAEAVEQGQAMTMEQA